MDRVIAYTGQTPRTTDILLTNRNMMIGIGMALAMITGTAQVVDGMPITPTSPASMQVQVGQGSIYTQQQVDPNAYSSLTADTTDLIIKQGITFGTTLLTLTAPATSGQSQNYLVQAAFSEVDVNSVLLPYYNASNPSTPWQGPNNSGTPQNTLRQGQCVISLVAGVPAATGSQTTPAPTGSAVGLYVITVANGQTSVVAGNISVAAGAPFVNAKLPALNAIIAAAGLTPTPTDLTQLLKALNILYARRATGGVTYYVRTDGNDGNAGTSNSSSGAFATITAAIAAGTSAYAAGTTINIQLGIAGTYAVPGTIQAPGFIINITGNNASQSTYILSGAGSGTGGVLVGAGLSTAVNLYGLSVANTNITNHSCGAVQGTMTIQNVSFTGPSISGNPYGILTASNGVLIINGGCTFYGSYWGAAISVSGSGAQVTLAGNLTLTSGVVVTGGFINASLCGVFTCSGGATFTGAGAGTGSAGPRCSVSLNGVISYPPGSGNLPGNATGSIATGGQAP